MCTLNHNLQLLLHQDIRYETILMTTYVSSALFLYTNTTRQFSKELLDNKFGTHITPLALADILLTPHQHLKNTEHVVVGGSLSDIKAILKLACEYNFSVGLIADKAEKSYSSPSIYPLKSIQRLNLPYAIILQRLIWSYATVKSYSLRRL